VDPTGHDVVNPESANLLIFGTNLASHGESNLTR
jgi:hypothetical protein